jgi:hypothetical protein
VTVLPIPDEITLVCSYLRPLIAPLEIFPDMGSTPDDARIRVTRIGGVPDPSGPLWSDRPVVRFESWAAVHNDIQPGDGSQLARANAETVRHLLRPEVFCGTHSTGVVSNVLFLSLADVPDDSWGTNRARARTRFDVQLSVHPLPA